MSTEDPLKNWQLQQGDESADQWKLQDAEQDLGKHMQLQEGESAGPQWQPVEYQREGKPRRRGSWILPSIVIIALLGVLGYVGWVALGQGGANPLNPGAIAGLAPTATAEALAATSDAAVSPTPAPATATSEPTATPSPEATATATTPPTPEITTVELISGTVNSPDGVNARSTPDTAGEIVTLLTQNEGVTVVKEENGWLQVILPDNRTAWVSAQFINRASQQVTPEVLAKIYTDAGLPAPELPTGGTAATPAAAPAPTEVTLAAAVSGDPGVNARTGPQADAVVVTTLTKGTPVTAIGRSADNLWVALRLPDGKPAWVLREFLSTDGSFDTLPVVDPAALVASAPLTATTAISTSAAALSTPVAAVPSTLQPNGIIPASPFTNALPVGPALTISDTAGVNVRSAPNTDGAILVVAPNGAVLPIAGRTADGAWYQVRLPDERMGWMAAAAIAASSDAGTAPVIGGEAPAPDATATTAVPATPAGPTVKATVSNGTGAALRSQPDQNLDMLVKIDQGTILTAIGRSADSSWVQVALDDGTTAWALAVTLTLDGDIATLPVAQ